MVNEIGENEVNDKPLNVVTKKINESPDEPEHAENNTQYKKEADTMSNAKFATTLASPLIIPIAICAISLFCMFIGIGWFFVGMTFFVSATSLAVGIIGIVGAIFNAVNGIGAVLLALGIGFLGLGMVLPTFKIATEFLKGYTILSRELIKKGKEFKKGCTKKCTK